MFPNCQRKNIFTLRSNHVSCERQFDFFLKMRRRLAVTIFDAESSGHGLDKQRFKIGTDNEVTVK
jgi:hypothetical protein